MTLSIHRALRVYCHYCVNTIKKWMDWIGFSLGDAINARLYDNKKGNSSLQSSVWSEYWHQPLTINLLGMLFPQKSLGKLIFVILLQIIERPIFTPKAPISTFSLCFWPGRTLNVRSSFPLLVRYFGSFQGHFCIVYIRINRVHVVFSFGWYLNSLNIAKSTFNRNLSITTQQGIQTSRLKKSKWLAIWLHLRTKYYTICQLCHKNDTNRVLNIL